MDYKAKDLVDHPFSFAVGVGIANGLLAKARGKTIDVKTATTLGSVLGLGETALVMYEPQSERGKFMSKMTLMEVGLWSVGGLLVGLLPFISWKPAEHGSGGGVLVAEGDKQPPALPAPAAEAAAAAGFGSYRAAPRRRRKVASRRR
jgi:hypothetical protein